VGRHRGRGGLREILRPGPVVGHLYRRATVDIPLDPAGPDRVAPQGVLVVIHHPGGAAYLIRMLTRGAGGADFPAGSGRVGSCRWYIHR
jgi:hypothetical protein